MDKLISIILPVYNTDAYFEACLNSLLPQLDDRAELIIIDDGSTDRCPEIAEQFRKDYPDLVTVISQENKGNTLARYAGIRIAKGTYIAFSDSDDLLDPDWYRRITEVIETEEPDMLLLRWQKFDDEGHLFETTRPPLFETGPVPKEDVLRVFLSSQRVTGLPIKVTKRKLFTDYTDWSDNDTRRLMEDKLISIQLFEGAKTFWYISDVLYHYRTHVKSITVSTHEDEHYTLIYTYHPMMEFLKRSGYDSEEFRLLLIENYASVMWEIILKTHRTCDREKALKIYREIHGFPFTSLLEQYYEQFTLPAYKLTGIRMMMDEQIEPLYDYVTEVRRDPDRDHLGHLIRLGKL